MDDFMLKPVHPEYLKVLLRMALRKSCERIEIDKAVKQGMGSELVGEENGQSELECMIVKGSSTNCPLITKHEVNDGAAKTAESIKSAASSSQSAAISIRTARTAQLMKSPTGDLPTVTFTSATPAGSDEE